MSTEFGNALRAARESAQLTQAQLADIIGWHFSYVSHLEAGRREPPDLLTIFRLGRCLDVNGMRLAKLAKRMDYPANQEDQITSMWNTYFREGAVIEFPRKVTASFVRWYSANKNRKHRQHLTLREIAEVVEELEVEFGWSDSVPRKFEKILVERNIHLDYVNLPHENWVGEYNRISSKIAVNLARCGNSPGRVRFTLAHEIGHDIIHNMLNILLNLDYEKGCVQCETEADYFAASVLIKADVLRGIVKQYEVYDDKAIYDPVFRYVLAKRFEVSVKAMEIRMRELGLITKEQLKSTDMPIKQREKLQREGGLYITLFPMF